MISIKHIVSYALLATIFASSAALANETYACKRGDMKRVVAVVQTKADATVPCEVTYTREDGSTRSLWQAQTEARYCEEKAAAFAETLRGMGWECAKQ